MSLEHAAAAAEGQKSDAFGQKLTLRRHPAEELSGLGELIVRDPTPLGLSQLFPPVAALGHAPGGHTLAPLYHPSITAIRSRP